MAPYVTFDSHIIQRHEMSEVALERRSAIARGVAVAKTSFKQAVEDGITGEAAKVAFWFFMSLFPAILALFAITGLVGGDAAFDWAMSRVQSAAPEQSAQYLERFIRQITRRERPGLLSVGLVLYLWSSSTAIAALTDALNTVYDIEDARSWWKRRALSLGVMVAMVALLTIGATAIVAGPEIVRAIGLDPGAAVIRWPLAFALMFALLWICYYVLPDRDQSGAADEVLVGAVVAGLAWIGGTALFRLYVANFGRYDETYGVVGAVIVLLTWLYLTAIMILFGGEVAATLEGRHRREGRATGD